MAARPFLEGQRGNGTVLVNGVVVKEVIVGFRVVFPDERATRLLAGQSTLNGGCDHTHSGLHTKNFEKVRVGDQGGLVKVQGFCSKSDQRRL